MDEAFQPLRKMLADLAAFRGEFTDEDAGVRTYIHAFEVESPIEMDVSRDAEGELQIGSTPPLYSVKTSFPPSIHTIRFKAVLDEDENGG
jgi:hypothetical protein